ncbi:hypothetical protein PR048_006198 [Dryococelus australis]|uniref:Uncharacterized protein n=1 Tax=Dryococelus australis TaxID=614101 RepID=A0ABQ9IAA0_9NEOP|nr:hypothetical protein PR048_006198 [Dryococelus australis]
MEWHLNERVGETGDPRENPPTNGIGSLQEHEWKCKECAEGKGLVVVVGNKSSVEKETQISGEGGNCIWDMLRGSFVEGVSVPMVVAKEERWKGEMVDLMSRKEREMMHRIERMEKKVRNDMGKSRVE